RSSNGSAEKPEVAFGKGCDVRRDALELGIGNTEPARERRGVLVRGNARDQSAAADVVRTVQREARVTAVDAPTLDALPHDDLHATPRVIRAIPVRRERAA